MDEGQSTMLSNFGFLILVTAKTHDEVDHSFLNDYVEQLIIGPNLNTMRSEGTTVAARAPELSWK